MEKTVTVLLSDQDAQLRRQIFQTIRSAEDVRIIDQSDNGYATISKTILLNPDVVLMNVQPEAHASGIYVCREICANHPETKVLLYDCSGNRDNIIKAFQMGASNVLSGSFSEEDLILSVRTAGRGASPIHESASETLLQEFRQISNLRDNLVYLLNVVTQLTPAEINMLRLMYHGMSNREICRILFISKSTLKTHISHILRKFSLESMGQVMEFLHATELFSLLVQPMADDRRK